MQGSGLSGPIPSGISILRNLTDLRVTDLNGSDSWFPQLNNMTKLVTLILRSCNIIGSLPENLGKLTNLEVLDVSYNKLTGPIPSIFGDLRHLDMFFLEGNHLTGSLPRLIDKPHYVDLSYNNLSIGNNIEELQCRQETVNLFASFSNGNSLGNVSCLSNIPCKTSYSLYINCGGNLVTDGRKTYDDDTGETTGPASFHNDRGKNWALINNGHFFDTNRLNYYNVTNSTKLVMENVELYMNARAKTRVLLTHHYRYHHRHSPLSDTDMTEEGVVVSLQEWQGWGTNSPLPTMVSQIVEDLKVLEEDLDAHMNFGGNGGKLQGNFRVQEDKKHRATYQALGDSEKKLQFYSARQIACRILGSRGYLCQKCWLPMEDCMCSKVTSCSLYPGIRFWLYMHPKDFLRQNNTGKILWQVFGVDVATLCLFGIPEHEEIMWNSLKMAGKSNVWCLYPNKNAVLKSVQNVFGEEPVARDEVAPSKLKVDTTQHFILIDGTWSNSAAMFRRLQDKAKSVWGDEDLACISLNPGASAMHKLRPQPSWDRTCTAAAAAGLLSELQLLPQFSSFELEKQAEAVEHALTVLLDALTNRRLRMGRSITRKMRHTNIQ